MKFSVLKPYKEGSDVFGKFFLEYRFSNTDEVDYEITKKGEPEKGSIISKKSLATFISNIIENPDLYVNQNLGINKPNF